MKRTHWPALGLAATLLGAYSLTRPGYAQEVAKDDMRVEATASLSKLVDAANRSDVKTVMSMISPKPEAIVIADGEVYQGPTDIQSHAERLLGQRSKYLFQLGSINIADVHGQALATGPYTLRSRDGDRALAFRGAVTFLMEKKGRRQWIVTHLHRSTVAVKPQLD